VGFVPPSVGRAAGRVAALPEGRWRIELTRRNFRQVAVTAHALGHSDGQRGA
jgi:hypothetical protein